MSVVNSPNTPYLMARPAVDRGSWQINCLKPRSISPKNHRRDLTTLVQYPWNAVLSTYTPGSIGKGTAGRSFSVVAHEKNPIKSVLIHEDLQEIDQRVQQRSTGCWRAWLLHDKVVATPLHTNPSSLTLIVLRAHPSSGDRQVHARGPSAGNVLPAARPTCPRRPSASTPVRH